MTQVGAKQKWQGALQNEKESRQGQIGPKPAPTRVLVPKGDYVNFRTTAGRTKEMNVATQKRKYDEDDDLYDAVWGTLVYETALNGRADG